AGHLDRHRVGARREVWHGVGPGLGRDDVAAEPGVLLSHRYGRAGQHEAVWIEQLAADRRLLLRHQRRSGEECTKNEDERPYRRDHESLPGSTRHIKLGL